MFSTAGFKVFSLLGLQIGPSFLRGVLRLLENFLFLRSLLKLSIFTNLSLLAEVMMTEQSAMVRVFLTLNKTFVSRLTFVFKL